ncbi:MAG: hypothetical protein HY070_08185 [Chloroflexi bacterium]|nr:hypothetical protein [Chloroflexota bacterium]
MDELFRDAIHFWEPRRIFYNAILALIFIGWIVLTWPHFSPPVSSEAVPFLIFYAIAANLCYTAAYLAEIPLQFSKLGATRERFRLGLWLVGTLFAILLTNYWIADEIYPYVR